MSKAAMKNLRNMDWMKEYEIPIRVLKAKPTCGFDASIIFRFAFSAFKKSLIFSIIILTVVSQSTLLNAFEAHVINVTATIEDGIAEYVVINEVYYDVGHRKFCAVDEEKEPRNEWVELYNPTDEPIDVSGWTIEDNDSFDVIPISPLISAHSFAVISKNDSTWLFWSIPPEAVKITLGSVIGNGLSNDGDRVILKDASGVEIDAVSYGDDAYAFLPPVPYVFEGRSIARSPKGFDTNKYSDWIELEVPNPGTNPHYEEHTDGTPCFGADEGSGGVNEQSNGEGDSEQPIINNDSDNGEIENENIGENSSDENSNENLEEPENGEENGFLEQVANEESIGENQGESDSAESENSENENSGDENNNEAALSEIENSASDENIDELEIEELPVSENEELQEIIVGKDDEAISSEEPKDDEGGEPI